MFFAFFKLKYTVVRSEATSFCDNILFLCLVSSSKVKRSDTGKGTLHSGFPCEDYSMRQFCKKACSHVTVKLFCLSLYKASLPFLKK